MWNHMAKLPYDVVCASDSACRRGGSGIFRLAKLNNSHSQVLQLQATDLAPTACHSFAVPEPRLRQYVETIILLGQD